MSELNSRVLYPFEIARRPNLEPESGAQSSLVGHQTQQEF